METENKRIDEVRKDSSSIEPTKAGKEYPSAAVILAVGLVLSALIYSAGIRAVDGPKNVAKTTEAEKTEVSEIEEKVLPSGGVLLPVRWGDLGAKLVSVGAIDTTKFKAVYQGRSAFTKEYDDLLSGVDNGRIKITKENSGYLLNMFWALGLANKNPILDSGEMTDSRYGGAGNFASTGGWTLAKGEPMDHYSRHTFFVLTPEQQLLVDRMSRGIYRSCCGNSTHFPDCNHGMAMLGLLELMASQGVSEEDMWKSALAVNSYWFPDTYLTIAAYMKGRGVEWESADPKDILGAGFSSASGYQRVSAEVTRPAGQGGGSGCGVSAGAPPAPRREAPSCGI